MKEEYFKRAWSDVVESDRWISVSVRLTLWALIPIVGHMIVYAYSLGWAREAAWSIKTPLPKDIVKNQEESFYRRGLFAFVIFAVYLFGFVAIRSLWDIFVAGELYLFSASPEWFEAFEVVAAAVSSILWIVIALAALAFSFVGLMRMSIYNRLGPGFQFEAIWNMLRYRASGVFSIVGFSVLWLFVCGIIAGGVVYSSAFGSYCLISISDNILAINAVGGMGWFFMSLLASFTLFLVSVIFCQWLGSMTILVVSRAFGLWVQQFEVARWRGQDDPMPFELEGMQTSY